MKVIDAVKQIESGEKIFQAEDQAVVAEAQDVIDLLKTGAEKSAAESVSDRMAALETAEGKMEETLAAAKTETVTAFATERARVEGSLKAAKTLGLGAEDVGIVLAAQKDGSFLTLEQAKDALMVASSKVNGGLQTPDGRQQTPVGDAEAEADKAMDAAIARRDAKR